MELARCRIARLHVHPAWLSTAVPSTGVRLGFGTLKGVVRTVDRQRIGVGSVEFGQIVVDARLSCCQRCLPILVAADLRHDIDRVTQRGSHHDRHHRDHPQDHDHGSTAISFTYVRHVVTSYGVGVGWMRESALGKVTRAVTVLDSARSRG